MNIVGHVSKNKGIGKHCDNWDDEQQKWQGREVILVGLGQKPDESHQQDLSRTPGTEICGQALCLHHLVGHMVMGREIMSQVLIGTHISKGKKEISADADQYNNNCKSQEL